MKIATFGVFDIIHRGHIEFLEECKKIAKDSELVVVIARDSTVRKEKGEPLMHEEDRRYIVQSLKPVDKAILGNEGADKFKVVEQIKPEIIALGYDQEWDEEGLRRELSRRGLNIKVIRLKKYGNIKSRDIKKRVKIHSCY